MKTEEINKILGEFDTIKSISPSDKWSIEFTNKLDASRMGKSTGVSKFSLIVLILVCVNVGLVWNSYTRENTKTTENKVANYQIIVDQLLITSNN